VPTSPVDNTSIYYCTLVTLTVALIDPLGGIARAIDPDGVTARISAVMVASFVVAAMIISVIAILVVVAVILVSLVGSILDTGCIVAARPIAAVVYTSCENSDG